MDIKDRLIAFINVLGIKRSEFAKGISVTQSNVSDWVNRKKPSKPSPPAMARINEVYGMNLNWLITGKGEMFVDEPDGKLLSEGDNSNLSELSGNKALYQHKVSPFESRNITLPIYGEIAAGEPVKNDTIEPWEYIEIPKAYLSDKESTYCALVVNGNSMVPRISNGDIVVIHERHDIDNLNGKICACQTPDGITHKKLQLDSEKRRIILRPLNQNYEVIVLEDYEIETFRLLGEMALQFRVF
ncbi:MAG: helix-turn-helix domain-containing protein [Candidatus Cloacimonetes bacterium]|nr:helix-turn-helix domain-containing protein [Candidatus Cloacimonadota bacterium]